MFAAFFADRCRLKTLHLSIFPVSSIRLIKSHKVIIFHVRDGNSRIIVDALHLFPIFHAFIKIFSFVKGAKSVNIN